MTASAAPGLVVLSHVANSLSTLSVFSSAAAATGPTTARISPAATTVLMAASARLPNGAFMGPPGVRARNISRPAREPLIYNPRALKPQALDKPLFYD
ncbi:MAG: hypothetical protein MZU79_06100 [Anaerotruncus sp.]|nr:hypothetical protein [Anaerotruncus sp.]